MKNGKLNAKFYPIIWVALLIACLVRNAYVIYANVTAMEFSGAAFVFVSIIKYLAVYGIVPTAIVFLCAFVVWQIGAARYVRCISRNDFCYLVMAMTAVVKFAVGIIEIFSILEPQIYSVTSTVFDFAFLTGAFLALYFFVIAKQFRFNPVEKYNSYRLWFSVYMVVAGISVLFENVAILSVTDGSSFSALIFEILAEQGISLVITEVEIGASIAAICIYFIYLIAVIVLGELLRKQSDKFRNPETRGEFYEQYDNRAYTLRRDADSVFDDASSKGGKKKEEENVFDEFDL